MGHGCGRGELFLCGVGMNAMDVMNWSVAVIGVCLAAGFVVGGVALLVGLIRSMFWSE